MSSPFNVLMVTSNNIIINKAEFDLFLIIGVFQI